MVHHSARKSVPQPTGKTPAVPRPSGEERSRNGHNFQGACGYEVEVWHTRLAPGTCLCLETKQIVSSFIASIFCCFPESLPKPRRKSLFLVSPRQKSSPAALCEAMQVRFVLSECMDLNPLQTFTHIQGAKTLQ